MITHSGTLPLAQARSCSCQFNGSSTAPTQLCDKTVPASLLRVVCLPQTLPFKVPPPVPLQPYCNSTSDLCPITFLVNFGTTCDPRSTSIKSMARSIITRPFGGVLCPETSLGSFFLDQPYFGAGFIYGSSMCARQHRCWRKNIKNERDIREGTLCSRASQTSQLATSREQRRPPL